VFQYLLHHLNATSRRNGTPILRVLLQPEVKCAWIKLMISLGSHGNLYIPYSPS